MDRNPQSGTIAIVVAALWMTLFGLAAFAVDIGYGYTTRRGLKAVTVAAVKAGMPGKDTSAATAMVNANGYTDGVNGAAVNTSVSGNDLEVDVSVTRPTFFLRLFGTNSKTVSAKSIGRVLAGAPAILATGGCMSQGLTITGNAAFTINGNVESSGPLSYANGPTIGTTNGAVKSACPGFPTIAAGANTITGGVSTGPVSANPFGGVTLASFPACLYGDLSTPYSIPFANWSIGAGPVFGNGGAPSDTLAPGVYCSGGNLNVSSPGASMKINAPGVTFIATGDITIGADNGAVLSPAAGSPNNIFVYTTSSTSCTAGQAINVGLNYFTFNGSMYAPNGCLRAGGKSLTVNTTPIVAKEIFLGLDPAVPNWTIGTAGGGTSWQFVE
jgi:Flp pilus assembly protein TadG